RVGRFLSIDPLAKKYPFYSPYSFSGNRVLDAVELEGKEPSSVNIQLTNNKGEKIKDYFDAAKGTTHLPENYFSGYLSFLGVKSNQFPLNSFVDISYNID